MHLLAFLLPLQYKRNPIDGNHRDHIDMNMSLFKKNKTKQGTLKAFNFLESCSTDTERLLFALLIQKAYQSLQTGHMCHTHNQTSLLSCALFTSKLGDGVQKYKFVDFDEGLTLSQRWFWSQLLNAVVFGLTCKVCLLP